jgi:hypothetical protein
MTENRLELLGLSVLVLTLTATVSPAQMPSTNTSNPIMSGNTVAQSRETPVSPALNTGALNPSTGTNPFTGMPCSGPPTTGGTTTSVGASFPSVYGPPPSAC